MKWKLIISTWFLCLCGILLARYVTHYIPAGHGIDNLFGATYALISLKIMERVSA
jgi:hypothetical protein